MNPDRVETIIAERRLHILDDSGSEVVLQVGMPIAYADGSGFLCHFQVVGIDKVHHANGIDAVHALEEALRLARAILLTLLEKHPGLRWEDADAGDCGFRSSRET